MPGNRPAACPECLERLPGVARDETAPVLRLGQRLDAVDRVARVGQSGEQQSLDVLVVWCVARVV